MCEYCGGVEEYCNEFCPEEFSPIEEEYISPVEAFTQAEMDSFNEWWDSRGA